MALIFRRRNANLGAAGTPLRRGGNFVGATKLLRSATFTLLFAMLASGLPAAEKGMALGQSRSGQAVALKVGEIFRVELPGIGGAGYNWYMKKFDSRFLELLSQETIKTEKGLVGSPVMHVWRFKARQPGHTQIRLDYYRKWEGLTTASKHFLLYINISQ
jgi:predicted secreted protein